MMARIKHKKKSSFAGIPKVVMESPDYLSLKGSSIRLLNEMAYQYNGFNNGDLSPSWTLMSKRGFVSKSTLSRALNQLIDSNLLLLTRQGGKNLASLYALTWANVDDLPKKRLELPPSKVPIRNFYIERQGSWR